MLSLLAACGQAAPFAAGEPTGTKALASAPRVDRPTASSTSTTAGTADGALPSASSRSTDPSAVSGPIALEHPESLRRFFDSLLPLEDGTATDDSRIIQLGDSHTAADWYTGVVRRLLQTRFGDGGRGFVAIGKPWKGYVQDNVHVGMTAEWQPLKATLSHSRLVGDGLYGLTGVAIESSQPGGSAWVDVPASDHVEVAYLAQPGGGPFDLYVDGAEVVRVSTSGSNREVHFRGLDVEPGNHRVEVRNPSNGKVRVFGVALDRQSKGVVLDAYGRDGARAVNLLNWDADHFAALLKWRSPSLVMLAFGTNECGDKDIPISTYERDLAELLGRIVRATPSSSCLLLGPPDYVQYGAGGVSQHPRLPEIIAAQRRVAEAAQCAFYDQVTAMGGAGSHAAWAQEDPPRARKDGVHMSREGYTALATRFVDEVETAYAAYRLQPRAKPKRDEPVANRDR